MPLFMLADICFSLLHISLLFEEPRGWGPGAVDKYFGLFGSPYTVSVLQSSEITSVRVFNKSL